MEFRVGQHFVTPPRGIANAIRVEAELGQRLAKRSSLRIAVVEHVRVERSGDRAATNERRAEAHTFLVGESDDFDRARKASSPSHEHMDAFDRGDDTQHPVVLARVAQGWIGSARREFCARVTAKG